VRHEEVREALGRHLEGELGSAARREVERHLSVCASCRAEHRELRATVELLRGLPDPEPPADLVPGVLRRLESAAAARRSGFVPRGLRAIARGAPLAAPIAALAAGLVLLAVASFEEDRFALRGADGASTPADREARAPGAEVARAREFVARLPAGSAAAPARPLEPAPPATARAWDEAFAMAPTRAWDEAFAMAPALEPRAPTGPSAAIDADALETVALDPGRAPRRPRPRFPFPAGVGVSAAPDADALPPRPALAACVGETAAQAIDAAAACRPWLQGMLTLAQYDPGAFLAEVETLPSFEAAAWLTQLARFSRETRISEGVANRLRSTPDARVVALARWFEAGPGEPDR
jgi:hypothetical protein